MRLLLILAAVVVVFALVGWISFSNDEGRSSVNLETDEIREDTSQAMDRGAELLNNAEEEIAPEEEVRTAERVE